MSSIAKRPNGQWRARYRDETGKEHAQHFAKKGEAKRWLDEVTAAVVRGDYVDPKAGRITLRAYAAKWEAVQVSSDGTARIVDNALRLHLLPELGDRQLASIRPTEVQGFVKKLEAKTLSPGTVRGIYHVTTQLFAAAVDDRLIPRTPCTRVRLPASDDEPVKAPTVEQVVAMTGAVDARWRPLVVALAGSGLRIGELLGLEVADVDFLRRTIGVERQRMQSGAIGQLKSKRSRRVVPVGQVVVDELAAHLAARREAAGGEKVAGPLFVDELGAPLRYRRWRSVWEAAAKAAGVDFTSHDLRHFYASALIAGGASVKQVQERLGHASPMITLQTYAHLWPGDDDRTRDVMDQALSPLADSLRTARVAQ